MNYSTLFCTISFVIMQVLAPYLASAFTKEPELLHTATWGLRILSIGFPLIGAPMIITTYFQAIGRARMAIILSLTRQLLLLIPLIVILPHFFGVKGVWYAQPVSDAISTTVFITVVVIEIRKIRKLMVVPQPA